MFALAAGDDDAGAELAERARNRQPESRAAARYERGLPGKHVGGEHIRLVYFQMVRSRVCRRCNF